MRVLEQPSSPSPDPSFRGIDPRIRRRRIEIRRREGRRRLAVVLAAATLIVGTLAAWGALRSPVLDVDRIAVTGARHTDRASLLRAAGLRPGEAMIDVDVAAAAAGAARLPWVASATVVRRWPGTLSVRVVERVPVAVIAVDGATGLLVDRAGRLLGPVGGKGAQYRLPVLRGVVAKGPMGSRLGPEVLDCVVFAEALAEHPVSVLAERSESLAPDPEGGVQLGLRPAGRVRLGPASMVDEKLSALAAVLSGADMANVAVVDVRVPSAPVLTRDAGVAKVSTRSTA